MRANKKIEYHRGEWVKEDDRGISIILQVDKDTSDSVYEPIELTSERLAINNFKYRGGNHFTYDYQYSYYIEVIDCYCERDGVTVNIKAGDYRDFMTELRIKVRYVHELQRAMELCGLKKELKIDEKVNVMFM